MIDQSQIAKGTVLVGATGFFSGWLRIMKLGPVVPICNYRLRQNSTPYPLQYGAGTYSINVYSDKDELKESAQVTFNAPDPDIVFLQPNVNMWFEKNSPCVNLAKGKTPKQIWRWMADNCAYDREEAKLIQAGKKFDYSPHVDEIFRCKKSICFGLTALYNSMLRSIGVKAIMCHGNVEGMGYHCWSRVELSTAWVLEDITKDLVEKAYQKRRNAAEYEERYRY